MNEQAPNTSEMTRAQQRALIRSAVARTGLKEELTPSEVQVLGFVGLDQLEALATQMSPPETLESEDPTHPFSLEGSEDLHDQLKYYGDYVDERTVEELRDSAGKNYVARIIIQADYEGFGGFRDSDKRY